MVVALSVVVFVFEVVGKHLGTVSNCGGGCLHITGGFQGSGRRTERN